MQQGRELTSPTEVLIMITIFWLSEEQTNGRDIRTS
jgi:hypothetical protein